MRWPVRRENPSVEYVAGSLAVSVFFPGVAIGVAYPTLPRLETVLDLSPLVVGLVISITGAVRLLCNAPAGSLYDRVGTRRPLIAGFLMLGVAPFGYAIGMDPGPAPVDPAIAFLVSRGTAGVGTALVLVGSYAAITNATTPENRGRWLGYMLGSFGLGSPLGMLAGGLVADVYGLRAAFLLAGGLGLVSLLIVLAVVPNCSPGVDRDGGIRAIPRLILADRRLAVIGVTNGVVKFLAAVFLTTVVLLTAEREIAVGGLGESAVSGAVLAVSTLCASVANLASGRYSDSLDNRMFLVLPSLLVLALGFVIVASVPTLAGVSVGVTIAGFGGGAVSPALFAYLGDISPSEDVGKLGGAYNVFGDLGGIFGPVVALPAASTIGFAAEYLLCAGISALAAVLVAKTLLSTPTTLNPALAE